VNQLTLVAAATKVSQEVGSDSATDEQQGADDDRGDQALRLLGGWNGIGSGWYRALNAAAAGSPGGGG